MKAATIDLVRDCLGCVTVLSLVAAAWVLAAELPEAKNPPPKETEGGIHANNLVTTY